jgi:hypothetical protein
LENAKSKVPEKQGVHRTQVKKGILFVKRPERKKIVALLFLGRWAIHAHQVAYLGAGSFICCSTGNICPVTTNRLV